MPTRNVVLTDHQANVVEQILSSARYQNSNEVLRDGLRMIETREAEDALDVLRSLHDCMDLARHFLARHR